MLCSVVVLYNNPYLFLITDSKVRSLMAYWYRPNITREEAIDLVRLTDSGAFIVRDSQTVAGGYALTIKVCTYM